MGTPVIWHYAAKTHDYFGSGRSVTVLASLNNTDYVVLDYGPCVVRADTPVPSVKVGDDVFSFVGAGGANRGVYQNGDRAVFPLYGGSSLVCCTVDQGAYGGVPFSYLDYKGDQQGPGWYAVKTGSPYILPSYNQLSDSFTWAPYPKSWGDRPELSGGYFWPRLERAVAGLDGIAGEYRTPKDGWSGPDTVVVGIPRFSRGSEHYELSVSGMSCGPARYDKGIDAWVIDDGGRYLYTGDLEHARSSVTFAGESGSSITWDYDGLVIGSGRASAAFLDFARLH